MGSRNKSKQKNKAEKPDGAAAEVAQKNGGGGCGKIISDPRFASVHSDPRFREAPKQKTKVAIDSRFNRMFTDKNFASSKARIDKRGKHKKDASQNKMKHYYRLEEGEEEEREREQKKEEELKKKKNVESEDEEEGESDSESEESESENEELKKKASKLKSESENSESESEDEEEEEETDDSSSTSTTDSDEEEDGDYLDEDDTFMQPEENVPEIDKETHRLAVVNMDWSQVKADDLYVLLSSFLPKGGQIKSVAVYPSEFGLKRMEEEAVHGPVGLFDDDDDDDKEDNENDDNDDNDEEIDEKKLRDYELSRLRYYYAVVECDSIATADYLYKTCDGVEFERSSVKLDLRFIPDDMELKHPPRDVASEAPPSYEGLDFQTRALQQSKVHVSWDDDEPQRLKALKRKFNDDQLAELELKEFLASDESGTDDDEMDNDTEDRSGKKHKKQDMYRALLESGNGSDGNDEEDDQDMEVTFNTGLEDISKRILEKKDKKSETVWEAYLRKRKEKKKSRKNKSKNSSEDESSDTDQEPAEQPDDFFIEEPSAEGSKGGGKGAQKGKLNSETEREAEASRAELELLLADDNGAGPGLKGYNLKRKKAKGNKGKELPDESKIPTANYDDPRFSALFNSPLFALDPTDPQFKRSAAYVRQLAQKQHYGDAENLAGKAPVETSTQAQLPSKTEDRGEPLLSDNPRLKTEKHELSSLVRSIKMKSKQVPLPSKGKVPGSQPPTKKRR